jgi:hypothetical protein
MGPLMEDKFSVTGDVPAGRSTLTVDIHSPHLCRLRVIAGHPCHE